MRGSLTLLLLLVLGAGCPRPIADDDDTDDDDTDDDDDDDSGDDDTGDDDTGDDDDTASLPCVGGALAPIDLTNPAELTDILRVSVVLFEAAPAVMESILSNMEVGCPTWVGDDISADDVGTATLNGDGCVTGAGARYDGVLVISWNVPAGGDYEASMLGNDFVLSVDPGMPGRGGSAAFFLIEIDGTFDVADVAVAGGTSNRVAVNGHWNAQLHPGAPEVELFPTHRVAPEGFDGTWVGEHAETVDLSTQRLQADVLVRCRSDLGHDWDLTSLATGRCSGEPDSGLATITADGHVVRVDPLADADCDGCFVYSLDGVVQGLPLCMTP